MTETAWERDRVIALRAIATAVAILMMASAHAQSAAGAKRPAAEARAPEDLTGYWVSIVTQDWRWRMVTPQRGQFIDIPLNPLGKMVADAWNPQQDTAKGLQCRAYGAAAIMNVPEHLHIVWQSPNTLRMETDNGMQTRLFHFKGRQSFTLFSEGEPVRGLAIPAASWQGVSLAEWRYAGEQGRGPPNPARGGALKVITRDMREGYLQRNGVPYSERAVLTEWFNRLDEPNGDVWLIDTMRVVDPVYLANPYIISIQFMRQSNGSNWDPQPCKAMLP